MRNRQLSQAWERWQYLAADMALIQRAMGVATRFWMMNKLETAFERWYSFQQEKMQILRDRRDAILTWAENQLVTAMNQWRYQTYVSLCAYDAHIKSAVGWALAHWRGRAIFWRMRTEVSRKQAVSKWRKDILSTTLSNWREGTTSMSMDSEDCQQAVSWQEKRSVYNGLLRWRDYAIFRAILAELMAQADFRYVHVMYSDGFQTWRSNRDMIDSQEVATLF